MNREILFRGQHRRKGEKVKFDGTPVESKWVYGGVCQFNEDRSIIYQTKPEFQKYSVYTDTVGQYTGLTDKNGRKIFEGDIIKCSDTINDIEFNAVVEFGNPNHDYSWGYQLKHISGEKPNLDILCWVDMEETGAFIEVIGNIHDNPELVRKDDENGNELDSGV